MRPQASRSEPTDTVAIYVAPKTYRRPALLVLGWAFFVIGSILLASCILSGPRTFEHHFSSWGQVSKMLSFSMAVLGLHLLRLYHLVKARSLRIDQRGILNGCRFFAWDEIEHLQGCVEMTPIRLVLRTKGWLPLDVYLSTDDDLTDAEYMALMQELEKQVAPRFKHLTFWPKLAA